MVGQKSKMRKERKKKKLKAFLEVAKLNEADEEKKNHSKGDVGLPQMDSSSNEDGPSPKRSKEEISSVSLAELRIQVPNIDSHLGQRDGATTSSEDLTEINHDASEVNADDLRKAYRERRNKLAKLPRFRLKESGEIATFNTPEDQRIPLFMIDIQHLIMCSLLGHHAPFAPPRWYQLFKFNKLSHTVVLVVDNVSIEDLRSADGILHLSQNLENGTVTSEEFNPKGLFPWRLELVGPSTYGSNLIHEMATIPLSNTQYDKVIKHFGSLEDALKGKAVYKVFRAMFPIQFEETERLEKTDDTKEEEEQTNGKDKFPRTHLLLSVSQMADLGYPLPLVKSSDANAAKQPVITPINDERHAGSLGKFLQSAEFRKNVPDEEIEEDPSTDTDAGEPSVAEDVNEIETGDDVYVLSRPWYKEVGPNSPLLAVDCEMCQTGKHRFELTRISVVDENLKVVYESFVKPHRKITNYLTRFSGITPSILKDVKTRLCDVQRDIRKLLPPDAILVGQSLNFDLHAMKMMHPYVIDTSISYNLTGERLRRTKLATLSRLFLSEDIQCWGSKGHDSAEDAAAAMKLILLKLSKSIIYGDAVLEGHLRASNKLKGLNESHRKMRMAEEMGIGTDCKDKTYATSIFSHVKRGQHSAIVVGLQDVITEYQEYVEEGLSCLNSRAGDKSAANVTANILPVENSREIISRVSEVMLNHQLSIVHATRDCIDGKISRLEKWCKKIVKYAAVNSLCIVIFGGSKTANGCCMIHLKKANINL